MGNRIKYLTKPCLFITIVIWGLAGTMCADTQCTLETLRGNYVFAGTGFSIVDGIAQPKAIVELINFKGDGTLSVAGATRSLNGVIAQIPPGGTGTYTVEAECSGTLSFSTGQLFDLFLSPHGTQFWMIQTNPNNVLQGTVTRTSKPERGND